jgi:hypothetical protein
MFKERLKTIHETFQIEIDIKLRRGEYKITHLFILHIFELDSSVFKSAKF